MSTVGVESRVPAANRRPKFRLEEISPLELVKICGVFVSLFVVMSTVWIWQSSSDRHGKVNWNLSPCDGSQQLATDDLEIKSNDTDFSVDVPITKAAGVCYKATHPTGGFDEGEALPVRYGLSFKSLPGAFMFTQVHFDQIMVGTKETLFQQYLTRMNDEVLKDSNNQFSMDCEMNGTAATPSICNLDRDIYVERSLDLQENNSPVFKFALLQAPPMFFRSIESLSFHSVSFNASFAKQELIVRYIFLVITGVVAAMFYYSIGFSRLNYPWYAWAHEQKWTFILLVLLIGFNNPFIYFMRLAETSQGLWQFVDISFQYTFLVGYFFALLSMTDHMAQTKKKSSAEFYRPKFLLLAPCWGVLVYVNIELNEPGVVLRRAFILVYLTAVIVIYLVWLFYLIVTMIHKSATVVGQHVNVSWRFKLLWCMNIVMVAGFGAALYRMNSWGYSGKEFVLGYAGFNFYVVFLACMFGPAYTSMPYRAPPAAAPEQPVEINDEYEVDDDY